MYRNEKKLALALCDSLIEMAHYAKDNRESCFTALSECLEGLNSLCGYLEERSSTYQKEYCVPIMEALGEIDLDGTHSKIYQAQINQFILMLKHFLKYLKKLPTRLKVLFVPYKASMWTAMESIWETANNDENCEAKVVVIPYETLIALPNGKLKKNKTEYEGAAFPVYVPIVFYQNFDLEEYHPDVIFFHNPYDNQNNLTRVPEAYYSANLKKHSDLLVYAPYYTVNILPKNGDVYPVFLSPGMQNADLILTQNEELKKYYIKIGFAAKKLLTLGSPKTDAVLKPIEVANIPLYWKKKSEGKICILFNCHFSFIMAENPICSQVDRLEWHLRSALDKKNCVLIFRPHPLCEQMLESRSMTQALNQFKKLKALVRNSKNGILDELGDYRPAFELSDAYLTTGSSLDNEYILTGKPVLLIGAGHRDYFCDSKAFKENHFLIDRLSLYNFGDFSVYPNFPTVVYADPKNEELALNDYQFRHYDEKEIGVVRRYVSLFRNYIDAIEKGIDPLKNQRKQAIKKAFLNTDGSCGEKVYKEIVKKLDFQFK